MKISFLEYEKQEKKDKIAIKNLELKLLNAINKYINNTNPKQLMQLKKITKEILDMVT
jgi:hypothetical protein